MLSLMANVKKGFTRFIIKHNLEIDVIPEGSPAAYRAPDLWDKVPSGGKFWYVDVNHCYWRLSYLMGYISKKVYEETLKKPEMKLYRNMALACVVAPKWRRYHLNGKEINKITEANDLYGALYNNVRHTAYNIMGEILKATTNDCYGYRVDGVMITDKHLQTVKDIMDGYNLTYTVTECEKIDHKLYYLDDQVRRY
jgi:hypothetical protein